MSTATVSTTSSTPNPSSPPTPVSLDPTRRRRQIVMTALLLVTAAAFCVRVLLGDFTFTFGDALHIILGGHVDVQGAEFILMDSKLPRAVAALLGGALFGACGSAMQSLVRNPLASPDVLGISLGSSTAAVFCVTVLGWSGSPVLIAAVLGGFAVSAVIMLLARGQTPRMILVGIASAAALQSVIQWILLKATAFQALDAMVWLTGSISDTSWSDITRMAVIGVPVIVMLAALAPSLRVLELGRPLAVGLGIPEGRTRVLTFVGIVLGVALATSACGPIAFVALLAGPIARRLVGRTAPVAAGLVGAIICLAADYIGAYLVPGGSSLPLGVITGLAGAPVLAWLLVSSQRRGVKGTS